MDIYRSENAEKLNEFLQSDSKKSGKRRSILSAPPLYTMDRSYLEKFLTNHAVSKADAKSITEYYEMQKKMIDKLLKCNTVEDEIPYIPKEEFELYPSVLSLSGMFYENDIIYTYDEYKEHIRQTEKFAETHPNYSVNKTSAYTFRNL